MSQTMRRMNDGHKDGVANEGGNENWAKIERKDGGMEHQMNRGAVVWSAGKMESLRNRATGVYENGMANIP